MLLYERESLLLVYDNGSLILNDSPVYDTAFLETLGCGLAASEYFTYTGNTIGILLSVGKIVDSGRLCFRLMAVFESLGHEG